MRHDVTQRGALRAADLQDEDEEVNGLPAQVQKVQRRTLVILVELDLLDDVWMLEDPQKNLVRDLERAEEVHL